ncbi:muscarinic acetylcholine receptor M1-like [Parasteatoda tepidariorum]|uniref:muscarinic acetylcholine receptor M1-like n=1 Tax=Parasteatoda tepidariorum TaxID=114398 RepID=UPI00077F997A|nr:muscarinic acetylcholine receptor DM1-like [Parasteatoda tepidariorum]
MEEKVVNTNVPGTCDEIVSSVPVPPYTLLSTIAIATITTILSMVTIIGNILVIISYNMDRRLRTISNRFLLSLASADLLIGTISMPLFTTYLLMGGWTLGAIVCDLWLALDYLCSNASVCNLLVISFDRYFSVTNPLKYRALRTVKLAYFMIGGAWILSFITWPPWIVGWPYIEGKRSVPDDKCYIQFLETNTYITVITCLIAFYAPVITMITLYYRIWLATEESKREHANLHADKQIDQPDPTPNPVAAVEESTSNLETSNKMLSDEDFPVPEQDKNCSHHLKAFLSSLCSIDRDEANDDDSPGGTTPSSVETPIQSSRTTSVTLRPDQIATIEALRKKAGDSIYPMNRDEGMYTIMISMPENEQATVKQIPDDVRITPVPMRSSRSTSALVEHSVTNQNIKRCSSSEALSAFRLAKQARLQRPNVKKIINKTQDRKFDSKAARTLSAILFAFIITWTPYNVLVLIKSVETFVSCDDIIPQGLWDFSYYLCYMNSMVNPLCYALANANFRKTYWRILTCTWRQKSKLSIIRGLHSKAS